MSREIRRVPLEFDWPLNKTWKGFLSPARLLADGCTRCGGHGFSDYAKHLEARWYGDTDFDPAETGSEPLTIFTPEVRAQAQRHLNNAPDPHDVGEDALDRAAQRLCDFWNSAWLHHLSQDDVDALLAEDRLYQLTHTCRKGEGWKPIKPRPTITAEQVNRWSIQAGGFDGHDSYNCSIVIQAACERAGQPLTCAHCDGQGSLERYPGQRAEAAAWEPADPPTGDGWQLWESVSEGSPISPVFTTAAGLVGWMSDPARGKDWVPESVAAEFIAGGWAPTGYSSPDKGFVPGVEWAGMNAGQDGST